MRTRRELDRLELLALAYLGLPLIVFLATWWTPPVSLLALLLLLPATWQAWRQARLGDPPGLGFPVWLMLAAFAAVWVGASGLAGGLPLDKDWEVRMLVLRDLTVGQWPVAYASEAHGELVLRLSMGYYLIPALWGKVTSVLGARAAQALWTWLGVLLVLALSAATVRQGPRRLAATGLMCLMVALFSGMDIVGWLNWPRPWPAAGVHIEWWDPLFQLSSNTTLLFWTPNHALPAWLAAAVVWRHRSSGLAAAPLALFIVSVCIWSPLACLGLAPLMLACGFKGQAWATSLRELLKPPVIAVLPVVLLIGCFVTFGIPQSVLDEAASQTQGQMEMLPYMVPRLLVFGLLEWGVLALLLRASGLRSWVLVGTALELIALPLLHFGPANDLVMRGGIAPMMLLTLACITVVLEPRTSVAIRAALAVVLLVGGVTPWQEMQRKFQPGTRWTDETHNLVERIGSAWHYVGAQPTGWMQQALRPPVRLPTHLPPHP